MIALPSRRPSIRTVPAAQVAAFSARLPRISVKILRVHPNPEIVRGIDLPCQLLSLRGSPEHADHLLDDGTNRLGRP